MLPAPGGSVGIAFQTLGLQTRMVRIKPEPVQRTAAWFSLAVAAAAVFVTLLVWWVWPRQRREPAVQRDLAQVTVTWQCASGHRFSAPGGFAPRSCPTCNSPADIVLTYRCPQHGRVELLARYRADSRGRAALADVRERGGAWRPVGENVRCPICGAPLQTARDEPANAPKTRGG